ncbi:MAG: TonB-dependent receptor, partial [Rhodothermales bacterium]|nr:TonB-dependent receptor [Rhodothermales bacterium]
MALFKFSCFHPKTLFSVLFSCGLCLVIVSGSVAQERGRVVGTVVSTESGLGIPDANVLLDELSIGGLTHGGGRFTIDSVIPGEYTLVVQLLGFRTHRETIAVRANETTTVAVSISPSVMDLGEILTEADRAYTTASSLQIRAFDMVTRPTRSSQDLLGLTPGLVTAQHAGGGKAEQIFLRGFDADHGTDVAMTVDGMPVNMVSHGHGQGYADLHFLLPEVVQS